MKKIVLVLIALFLISYTKVEAASYNISASKTSATVGENVSITVTVYAGAWNLHVNGAVSGDFVGYSEDGNASRSQTFTFNKSTPGTYTVTLTGDITDYDTEEKTSSIERTISVTINPAPVQQDPQPAQQSQPQGNTSTSTTNTTNTNNNKKEEVKEEKKETPKLNITKFDIVGYDIKFDAEKLNYSIDISKSIKSLYIIVDGDNIEVIGDKKVDISGKDKITITVKNKDISKTYTIKLNRKEKVKIEKETNKINYAFIGTTFLFALTTIGSGAYIIKDKKKK